VNLRRIAVAAIVLVLAGCGNGVAKKREEAAAAQWRTGLARWDTSMTRAIDELSALLGVATSLHRIQHGDPKLITRLTASETTLLGCTKTVKALGLAPAGLAQARMDALLACTNLEQGAMLVRDGVRRLQIGLGSEALGESSEPLGSGQDALQRVRLELRQAD